MALCSSGVTDIICSLITVVGVLITTIVGFKQFRINKWCATVSKERMIWLKSFRKEVGKIMKAYELLSNQNCYKCNNYKKCNKGQKNLCRMDKIILEAEEARYILITRINTNKLKGNEYNFRYKEILEKIEFNKSIQKRFPKKEFLLLTNLILEEEWRKVKREAKGKNG